MTENQPAKPANPYTRLLGIIALACVALGVAQVALSADDPYPSSSSSTPWGFWVGAALGVVWLVVKATTHRRD